MPKQILQILNIFLMSVSITYYNMLNHIKVIIKVQASSKFDTINFFQKGSRN